MLAPLALALLLAAPAAPDAPAPRPPPPAAPRPLPKPPAATAAPPRSRLATRASTCRPTSARRCHPGGCEPADEGLHAELFDLDAGAGSLGACLYTDCYSGKARVVRDPEAPWQVTGFGEVHSSRPVHGVPPPGSAPFALTISVDLRNGRFTAIWGLSPEALQVDFGTCELRR